MKPLITARVLWPGVFLEVDLSQATRPSQAATIFGSVRKEARYGQAQCTSLARGMGDVLVPVASYAQSAPQTSNSDWYGPWRMMPGSGWGFWWMFPLLMMVVMLVGCGFMMRFFRGRRNGASSAVRLLNERFARGEIPREEYEEKRAILARPRYYERGPRWQCPRARRRIRNEQTNARIDQDQTLWRSSAT